MDDDSIIHYYLCLTIDIVINYIGNGIIIIKLSQVWQKHVWLMSEQLYSKVIQICNCSN